MQDKHNKLPKELKQYVKEYEAKFHIPDVNFIEAQYRKHKYSTKDLDRIIKRLVRSINRKIHAACNNGLSEISTDYKDLRWIISNAYYDILSNAHQVIYFDNHAKDIIEIVLQLYRDKGYLVSSCCNQNKETVNYACVTYTISWNIKENTL